MIFHHEDLQVYRATLDFARWLVSQPDGRSLTNKLFRHIDEAATSMVLNTAEGNGRYAELDQSHFIEIAQKAAVKAMVYLDLSAAKRLLEPAEIEKGKDILRRVNVMFSGF